MSATIDAIDRDVFQHEVVSVAEEMSKALCRSAFSPIIRSVRSLNGPSAERGNQSRCGEVTPS